MDKRTRFSVVVGMLLVLIGGALVVQTAMLGGGLELKVGYLMGVGLVVAGFARLWLVRYMARGSGDGRGDGAGGDPGREG